MNEKNRLFKEYISLGKHKVFRNDKEPNYSLFTSGEYSKRASDRFCEMLNIQDVVFLPNEMFIPTRTTKGRPDFLTENDKEIKNHVKMHECGWVSNINPDYKNIISKGLLKVREEILVAKEKATSQEKKDYADCMVKDLDALMDFADKYKNEARKQGLDDIADILENVPKYPAKSYREALQFFRIIHFALWLEGNYHITVGRFDQYMLEYLKNDLDNGVLTYEEALEMTINFFIGFNKDSDLYFGIQQGDNGQSMMLGGVDENGNDTYNILSEICLKASLEVQMIDPKINLRVNKNTPMERLVFASHLTAAGLGFPQYSNDDVVIPALLKLGYDKKDAYNYTVAACWEFIIPGTGMEIPNVGLLSFADAVNVVIHKDLAKCKTFDEFVSLVKEEIFNRCKEFPNKFSNLFCRPAPFMSVCMDNCIANLSDITKGNLYNNYGIHGVGVSTGADSMEAVKKLVFEGNLSANTLVDALDKNFEGYEELRNTILTKVPHMGNNEDEVDKLGEMLLDTFANALKPLKNDKGGCFRAGTGTAPYYSWERKTGATADGRRKDDYLPANYTPSLYVKLNGPLSVISSFTKPDLTKTINGGPLTLELASSAVCDEEGIAKTAYIVKKFVDLGGHQMQINVVNKDKLIDAQKHPELYKNLVVRVWGWSGYFVELDKEFQDQIIQRTIHNA